MYIVDINLLIPFPLLIHIFLKFIENKFQIMRMDTLVLVYTIQYTPYTAFFEKEFRCNIAVL